MQITIIGLGLIGGSIGLSIKKRTKDIKVIGVDIDDSIIKKAVELGAIDGGTTHLKSGVEGSEIIILSTYGSSMKDIVKEIAQDLPKGTILTDVGSIKEKITKEIIEILPEGIHFVGGHPMAGTEKKGIEAASDILFENAAYCLTPTFDCPKYVVNKVKELINLLGAFPLLLSPKVHDYIIASVSHLPQIIASVLVNTANDVSRDNGETFFLAAGGFRDTTRIASSNPELWKDIILTNKENILDMLEKFQHNLNMFKDFIKGDKGEELQNALGKAKIFRDKLPSLAKGILPTLEELYITIPDKPGAIGEITMLMGKEGINITDIEILRTRELGTLRIGLGSRLEKEKAYNLLKEHYYTVTYYQNPDDGSFGGLENGD